MLSCQPLHILRCQWAPVPTQHGSDEGLRSKSECRETDDDVSIERERARLILVKNTRVPAGHEAADVRRARHDECLGGRRERERGMETKPGGQEVL